MPFGLKGAPATFQRTMDVVLSGLEYNICLCYLDDILVFSSDFESHLIRLAQVFSRIRKANLKFNPNKCLFVLQEVTFLGFKITPEGQLSSEDKVKAIRNFPVPRTVKQVRGFIGLASFYRKFVKDFSKIASPLTQLTKKDQPFKWGKKEQESFELLKTCLSNPPLLAHHDPKDITQICPLSDFF